MKNFKMKPVSSLEKVFLNKEPSCILSKEDMVVLKNETLSFQISYTADIVQNEGHIRDFGFGIIKTESALENNINIRKTAMVPVLYPCPAVHDEGYIGTEPGLYPDLLDEIVDGNIEIMAGKWTTLWVDIIIGKDISPGCYDIKFSVFEKFSNTELGSLTLSLEVLNALLPEQSLIHTEWFHGDCLADYYEVEVFSERHWEIMGNFIDIFEKYGINMILTPLFTPPLDTAIGLERTSIQLVDIEICNGRYTFGFDKLRRFVKMCLDKGIKYFEMSHLYSQWGAKYAPKIMAYEDGIYKRIFGWDTLAVSDKYGEFLKVFLPKLKDELKTLGIDKNTYFHISDEPGAEHLEAYKSAKAQIEELLEGFVIIDALSDIDFYKTGLVNKPIPSTSHAKAFLDEKIENPWVYYCGGGGLNNSSRLIAMPSARNRILGTLLYKYDIEGFLHWGFNFYNSQYSIRQINPFYETSSGYGFAAGDAYLVYPGRKGVPLGSIRLMVFFHGLQDLRAFKLLETLTSREHVMEIIEKDLEKPLEFDSFPIYENYLLSLRRRIYCEIKQSSKLHPCLPQ